jgi:hypothetical protein
MSPTRAVVQELETRFGYSRQQMETKGNWIVVYSEAERKHVRLLVEALPEKTSEKAFVRANKALIVKAHRLGSDYALGVVGTRSGGFRSAFRTAGASRWRPARPARRPARPRQRCGGRPARLAAERRPRLEAPLRQWHIPSH